MIVLSFTSIFYLLLVACRSEESNSNITEVVKLEKKQDATAAALPPTSVDSRFFDLGGIINELFPGLNQGNQGGSGRNPSGMDFPTNSQFYPADTIQGPNTPVTSGQGGNWPVIDDAKHFPNQGSFGGFPLTQYPHQGNIGGAPQIQNQYPNQGNFGSSFPNPRPQYPNQGNFGRPPAQNGRYPNQWNLGGQPVINGQYPNQGGSSGSFPSQYPNQGNFGSSQPNLTPQYPNPGNLMGSQPVVNTQYPNQGNVMGSQPNLNSQYPSQGNFGVSQPNQFQPFPNQVNNGNPMQNQFPNQGGDMNQKPNNFGPGSYQIGDGTLDSLMPPDGAWNNSPNDFGPAQFNRSNPNLPDTQLPGPEYPMDPEERPNAILGNPVIVPSTTTERGRINFPSSTESAVKKQCVQDCQTTSEYNPVCGSDNVTYINPGKFVCARNCGIDVFVMQRGRCPDDTPFPRNVLAVNP